MSHLPLELIILILEFVFCTGSGNLGRETVRSCARVCSLWREPAQQLLFQFVQCRHHTRPLASLKHLFDNPTRGRVLRTHVRGISIPVSSLYPLTSDPELCYDAEAFVQILSLFPNLDYLRVDFVVFQQFVKDLVDRLYDAAAKNDSFPTHIRHIRLMCRGSVGGPQLCRLLCLWPTLQVLSAACSMHFPPPVERPNFTLTHLKLGFISNPDLIRWLVPNHSLTTAELGPGFETPDIESFLTQHGGQLRSLGVEFFTRETAPLLNLCPHLEELKFNSITTYEAINLLPKNLVKINVVGGIPIDMYSHIIHALPLLRIIGCPRSMKERTVFMRDAQKMLEDECVARGVIPIYDQGYYDEWPHEFDY